jgi:putative membrane protein
MKLLSHWLLSALAILIVAYVVPGVTYTSLVSVLVAAVVLGALNLVVRPVLMILTLPINVVTLGLFSIVINAFLVWLTSLVVPGFLIASFWTAILFALGLMVINWVFHFWSRA